MERFHAADQEKALVGTLTIEGHYDAKRNVTQIKTKVHGKEDEVKKELLPELVIVGITTRDGNMEVSY